MDRILEYIDIIILVFLGIFLFFAFKRVLGKKIGYAPTEVVNKSDEEIIINKDYDSKLNRKDINKKPMDETSEIRYPKGSLAYSIEQIRNKDPFFEPKTFLEGAKKAFTMIVVSFAKGDIKGLEPFVSNKIYDFFSKNITSGEEKTYVEIKSFMIADIYSASLEDDKATLKVKFITEQFRSTYKDEKELAQINTNKTAQMTEFWTFVKDLKEKSTIWKLSSIST